MTNNYVRLGSTYRVIVPFYALNDGITLTDLDAVPTLQMYDQTGITAVGSPVTCTKDGTGTYHGDVEIAPATFTAGVSYLWKMSGLSGGKAQSQTGYFTVQVVV